MAIYKPYIQSNKQLVMNNNHPILEDTTPVPITISIIGTAPNFSLSPCPGDGYWSWRNHLGYVHEGSASGCNKAIVDTAGLTEIIVGFYGSGNYTNGPLQSGDPDYFGVDFPHCVKRNF